MAPARAEKVEQDPNYPSRLFQNSSHWIKKPVAKLRFVARCERATAQQIVHQKLFSFINALKKDKRV